MGNKLPSYKFWDWKSIIRTCIVLLVLGFVVLFFLNYSDWKRNQKSKNFSEETTGIVIDYVANEYISMSVTGNKLSTLSYEVTYQITVNGKQYVSHDKLVSSPKVQYFINKVEAGNNECIVKYDAKNPSNNQLVLK